MTRADRPDDAPGFARRPLLRTCGVAILGAGALVACGGPQTTPTTPAPGPLANLDDVPVGRTTVVASPNGAPVALVRTEAGVVAHSAICTHQGCAVVGAGATLSCPCHGSVFDATTGAVQQGPADRPLLAIPVAVQGPSIVVT